MSAAAAMASVLVDEMVRGGLTDAVLAPGSRSAPLALALAHASRAGRIRLHVRMDERTAGFLALGLARGSGRPVPVICTSGTAVANLHPAVLEAHHDGIGLVLLTADRPPQHRGVGANQVTDQAGLFRGSVRLAHDVALPHDPASQGRYWRSVMARALLVATGAAELPGGPVHLNVGFPEPLLARAGSANPAAAVTGERRVGERAWTLPPPTRRARGPRRPDPDLVLERSVPTLVIAGHGAGPAARELAESGGWPLLAEPSSGSWGGPNVISSAVYVAADAAFVRRHRPRRIVVTGRPTLGRPIMSLLSGDDSAAGAPEVVVVRPPDGIADAWPDPVRTAATLAVRPAPKGRPAHVWLDVWRGAGASAWLAARDELAAEAWPTEPAVAAQVVAALPPDSLLFLGSSQPVRDVHLVARPRDDLSIMANRGLSGIDGTVSAAIGAALASTRPAYCLLGDLAFLHDVTALFTSDAEPTPDLTLIVLNNDGGGIFHLLEQGAPEHSDSFERVFGTPTGVSLEQLCAAVGVRHSRPDSPQALAEAIVPGSGLHVVEVVTDRSRGRDLHARLAAAAAEAVQ